MLWKHLPTVVVMLSAPVISALVAEASEPVLWAVEATRKVEPTATPELSNRIFSSARAEVRIRAARRESEGFHLVITTGDSALSNLDLQVSALGGSAGSIATAQIHRYREAFFPVLEISRVWGHPPLGVIGSKPDALIPLVDPYGSGRELGAPFDVPAGTSQPLWVLVEVPDSTAPGTYTGTLEVFRRTESGWLLAAVHSRDDKVRAAPFEELELELDLLWGSP